MFQAATKQKSTIIYKILSGFIAFTFLFTLILPPAYAQVLQGAVNLPVPGTMVMLSDPHVPCIIKGVTVYYDNPFQFDFIVDTGNDRLDTQQQIKEESRRLIKYFLAALTVPEEDLWVNLSPYEEEKIIADNLSKTEMGRDMLAQDYLLKQLSSSLIYPEEELGEEFWQRAYAKAQEKYGTTEIPLNTFNKVWIVPEKAVVFEHGFEPSGDNDSYGRTAFVVEMKLKVMLEEDYIAMQQNLGNTDLGTNQIEDENVKEISSLTSEIYRELILPQIEKEVNHGKTFANLRQIVNSLVLATWYKRNLQESILGQVYADKNKLTGVDLDDPTVKEKIYNQYVEALQKGVFNYIKEDYDQYTLKPIPRKYFSGGLSARVQNLISVRNLDQLDEAQSQEFADVKGELQQITVGLAAMEADQAEELHQTSIDEVIHSVEEMTRQVEAGERSADDAWMTARTIDWREIRNKDEYKDLEVTLNLLQGDDQFTQGARLLMDVFRMLIAKDSAVNIRLMTAKDAETLKKVQDLLGIEGLHHASDRGIHLTDLKDLAHELAAFMGAMHPESIAFEVFVEAINQEREFDFGVDTFEQLLEMDRWQQAFADKLQEYGQGWEDTWNKSLLETFTGFMQTVADRGARPANLLSTMEAGKRDIAKVLSAEEKLAAQRKIAEERIAKVMPALGQIGINVQASKLLGWVTDFAGIAQVNVDEVGLMTGPQGLVMITDRKEFAPQKIAVVRAKEGQQEVLEAVAAALEIDYGVEDEIGFFGAQAGQEWKGHIFEIPVTDMEKKRAVLRAVLDASSKVQKNLTANMRYMEPQVAVSDKLAWDFFSAEAERSLMSDFEQTDMEAREQYKELYEFLQDLINGRSTKLVLTKELVKKWKLKEDLVGTLMKLAPKATAGMRAIQNYLNAADLSKPMNMLIGLFTFDQLSDMAIAQAQKQGDEKLEAVVAGEVRSQTPVMNDMMRRRLAAKGFIVHSPQEGVYLPIGATSFVTTLMRMFLTDYSTSSHAARMIYCDKVMGFTSPALSPFARKAFTDQGIVDVNEYEKARSEGAQMLPDEMVALAKGIEAKINHILETGEAWTLEFADADDANIRRDLDNPEMGEENIDVSGDYTKYLEGAYMTDDTKKSIKAALDAGMQVGYHQANGASYGFNQRVYKKLFGDSSANIEWINAHPDRFFDGTGMAMFNKKGNKYLAIRKYIEERAAPVVNINDIKADMEAAVPGYYMENVIAELVEKEYVLPLFTDGLVALTPKLLEMEDISEFDLSEPFQGKEADIFNVLTAHTIRGELDDFFTQVDLGFTIDVEIDADAEPQVFDEIRDEIKELNQEAKMDKLLQGAKTLRLQVFAPEAEMSILRVQGMPYVKLSNGNLLGYYEPSLQDLTQDVSLLEVVQNSGLAASLKDKPIGYVPETTDPDGDRFVNMQIERNDEETKARLKKLNLAYLVLSKEKLAVVYAPNQNYFQIQRTLISELKKREVFKQDQVEFNEYDDYTFFGITTTVSTNTWRDLWRKFNIPIVQVPVGFKEIARMQRLVEYQVAMNEAREAAGLAKRRVVVHDIFGKEIDLGYNPRMLFGGEESGGMVAGTDQLLESKDGVRKFLGWREKSAVEASVLNLAMVANMFNQARQEVDPEGKMLTEELYANARFQEMISLSRLQDRLYDEVEAKNTAELRTDFQLEDLIEKMKMPPKERKAYENRALARRDANDAFFCSLAFAIQDGDLTLEQAKEILKDAFATDKEAIKYMTQTTKVSQEKAIKDISEWVDQELVGIYFQGDGVYMEFASGGYAVIRPSGTDPKMKGYPSTNDAYISALWSNAITAVDPTDAVPEKWEETMRDIGREDLLDVEAVMERKDSQYQRALSIDQAVSWAQVPEVQNVLTEVFGDEAGIGFADVLMLLGPRTQQQKMLFQPESRILRISWDYDAQMSELAAKGDIPEIMRRFREDIPEVAAFEELSTERLEEVTAEIDTDMRKGLSGERSSLEMLRTFLSKATGEEEGDYIGIDWGGTNLRVMLVHLTPGQPAEVKYEVKEGFPREYISGERNAFDFIAAMIERLQREAGMDRSRQYAAGFTYSFANLQQALNSGISTGLHGVKGWNGTNIDRKDVVKLLTEAIDREADGRRGIKNVSVEALVNDTVGTQLVSAADIGLIYGTGFNISMIDENGEIRNVEAGAFDNIKLPYSKYDWQMLERHRKEFGRGKPYAWHTIERMISGNFIGERARLMLVDQLENQALIDAMQAEDSFTAKMVSDILEMTEYGDIENYIRGKYNIAPTVHISTGDMVTVKNVLDQISRQSAQLVAAIIVQAVRRMDKDISREFKIAIDGPVYVGNPLIHDVVDEAGVIQKKGYFRQAMESLIGDKADNIKIVTVTDGSGVGAAVAAAVAMRQKQDLSVRSHKYTERLNILASRDSMGQAAAKLGIKKMQELLEQQDMITIMFAAAPSQVETVKWLVELTKDKDSEYYIDWRRINIVHMDEWVSRDPNLVVKRGNAESFRTWLDNNLINPIVAKHGIPLEQLHLHLMDDADNMDMTAEEVAQAYGEVIKKYGIDGIFGGYGDNGHVAFNDAVQGNLEESKKLYEESERAAGITEPGKDPVNREQQMRDYPRFRQAGVVPTAVTVRLPIMKAQAKFIIMSVPGKAKQNALMKVHSQSGRAGEVDFDPFVPATYFSDLSPDVIQVFTDREGAGLLPGAEDIARNAKNTVGGIDLNPALFSLQIRTDDKGVPLPLPEQPVYNLQFDGFVPVIIDVIPIPNMQMLLGGKPTIMEEGELTRR